MENLKNYKSAAAFRRALEDRLKNLNKQEGTPLDRLRRQVAFDRFAARLFSEPHPVWLLKGGYALEVRLHNVARATKDIDFALLKTKEPTKEKIQEMLQGEAAKELGVTRQTLYYWFKKGWVKPKRDYRRYPLFTVFYTPLVGIKNIYNIL